MPESHESALLKDVCTEDPCLCMSLVSRKPVFGVCDQVRLKPACAATEAR